MPMTPFERQVVCGSLLLLCAGAAHASGTAIWLDGTPDPAVVLGSRAVTPEDVIPNLLWSDKDDRAMATLASELSAVRPLVDAFDGEIEIMRRLDNAANDVTMLRESDRDTLFRALIFQGFAVHRYFQDKLATEPAADIYRTTLADGTVVVRPWMDAVALDPSRAATEEDIPDAAERVAFQELRARLLLMPPGTVTLALETTQTWQADGKAVDGNTARLQPGLHRIYAGTSDRGVVRAVLRVESGANRALTSAATPEDLRNLAAPLGERVPRYVLPEDVVTSLGALDQPVSLVVPGRTNSVYQMEGDSAVLQTTADDADQHGAWALQASAGLGLVYDGDYYLLNLDGADPAPHNRSSVNALAPVIGGELDRNLGRLFTATAGLNLMLPLGDHHVLPTGDGNTRLRVNPFLAFGLHSIQVEVGALFPWHSVLGLRGALPLTKTLDLSLAIVAGAPVTLARGNGDPDFQSSSAAATTAALTKTF